MNLTEFIFGKKEEPMTEEELEKYTARREKELDSKTRIVQAQTKYEKACAERAKALSSLPKGSTSMAGLFSKKSTWIILVGVIFLIVVIKAIA